MLGLMRAFLIILGFGLSGCSDPHIENYDKTVAHGTTSIPSAAQFKALFPKSKHFISYYIRGGSPKWNSKAGIAGRYVLTMQIPITLDRAIGRVTKYESPEFFLNEVISVLQGPDGRFSIRYGRNIRFGMDDWQRFVASGGDLSIFGITTPIEPVPRFNEILDAA